MPQPLFHPALPGVHLAVPASTHVGAALVTPPNTPAPFLSVMGWQSMLEAAPQLDLEVAAVVVGGSTAKGQPGRPRGSGRSTLPSSGTRPGRPIQDRPTEEGDTLAVIAFVAALVMYVNVYT